MKKEAVSEFTRSDTAFLVASVPKNDNETNQVYRKGKSKDDRRT